MGGISLIPLPIGETLAKAAALLLIILLCLQVRLQFFFYSLYIPEWLALFPRESFLILKTEEYAKDIAGTLNKCLEFLGLGW